MRIATSVPRRHPDVVYTTLPNGEIVLLHLDTKQYFSLNETGSRVWELLDGERSVEEIGRQIERSYDVTLEEAHGSVESLIRELVAANLVSVQEADSMVSSCA